MSTLEFVSTSADGIAGTAVPLVTAPTLITGLGSHPAVTVPLVCGRAPATHLIWQRLADTAEFYGTPIADVEALDHALRGLLNEAMARHGAVTLAADVLAVTVAEGPHFVVSATIVQSLRPELVTLTVQQFQPVPQWRRMAAHTTSRAAADRARLDLAADGHVDIVDVDGDRIGRPCWGALMFDTDGDRVGTGVFALDLLGAAGLLEDLRRTDEPVDISEGSRAWWISPVFERHPVAAIGTRRFEVPA
ncbi:hypothetical protein ACWDUN_04835 [Mycobacterium sp. NPDC003323]